MRPGRPALYGKPMEPHKIHFPTRLWRRAKALARSRSAETNGLVTTAEVVREALAVYLNLHEVGRK